MRVPTAADTGRHRQSLDDDLSRTAAVHAYSFISAYAGAESEREALGIRFVALLPKLTPATGLGVRGCVRSERRHGP